MIIEASLQVVDIALQRRTTAYSVYGLTVRVNKSGLLIKIGRMWNQSNKALNSSKNTNGHYEEGPGAGQISQSGHFYLDLSS